MYSGRFSNNFHIFILFLVFEQYVCISFLVRTDSMILAMCQSCRLFKCIMQFAYCKVASSSPSCFEAHAGLFRLLMKGGFYAYVLWPVGKKFIFELVTSIRTQNSMVNVLTTDNCGFQWCGFHCISEEIHSLMHFGSLMT